jgi:hypothetical protein
MFRKLTPFRLTHRKSGDMMMGIQEAENGTETFSSVNFFHSSGISTPGKAVSMPDLP